MWLGKWELLPIVVVLGPVEVEIYCFKFVLWAIKEILFNLFLYNVEKWPNIMHERVRKFTHHQSLKITFENGARVRMTHYNISIAVNAVEVVLF